jgi:hypothetical protein
MYAHHAHLYCEQPEALRFEQILLAGCATTFVKGAPK